MKSIGWSERSAKTENSCSDDGLRIFEEIFSRAHERKSSILLAKRDLIPIFPENEEYYYFKLKLLFSNHVW